MAMMPSASGGSSTRTDSPFVIDHDDDSGLDNDLIDDEGAYLFDGNHIFSPSHQLRSPGYLLDSSVSTYTNPLRQQQLKPTIPSTQPPTAHP
jgi:hypothetical protein